MNTGGKFPTILKYLMCFLFIIHSPVQAFGEHPLKNRILSPRKRTYIIYTSSSYSPRWAAEKLLDRRKKVGWRSEKDAPFPHTIVFELAAPAKTDLLKFSNKGEEEIFPGISAKNVQVEFSVTGPDSDYINVGNFTLEKGAMLLEFPIKPARAHWVRLSIHSNHGHSHFTELMEFEAWGVFEFNIIKIISNLVWILGVGIILATLSFHEFLAHVRKTKRIISFKSISFNKHFLWGLILVGAGSSVSISRLFPAVILGLATVLLIIFYIKFIKFNSAKKQENRD